MSWLSKYIICLKGDFGEWFIDKENDGSMEHPIQMPYVMYFKTIDDFIDDVHRFVDLHEDMGMTDYRKVIKIAELIERS